MMVDNMVDTNPAKYLFQKRRVFYYSRHIPTDLSEHYKTRRLVFSLKTKSQSTAEKASRAISQRLDDYWSTLRLSKFNTPPTTNTACSKAPRLSKALINYLHLKGNRKPKSFHLAANRIVNEKIELLGDKLINQYTSADAAKFRDHLLDRSLKKAFIKRYFSSVKAIVNLAISEEGIECRNPFAGIFIPDLEDGNERKSIPLETIREIQTQCFEIDDDKRWLIAMISDSGMRLSEALGLSLEDICLDHSIPHLNIVPHPWRPLKTKCSERQVPLTGASLWTAKRIFARNTGSPFAFPRYTNNSKCNANSASAALNKWLRQRAPDGCVIHSFRHSLRDRLRAVDCPADIIDQIGGWSTSGVGQGYGNGHPLALKAKKMRQILS